MDDPTTMTGADGVHGRTHRATAPRQQGLRAHRCRAATTLRRVHRTLRDRDRPRGRTRESTLGRRGRRTCQTHVPESGVQTAVLPRDAALPPAQSGQDKDQSGGLNRAPRRFAARGPRRRTGEGRSRQVSCREGVAQPPSRGEGGAANRSRHDSIGTLDAPCNPCTSGATTRRNREGDHRYRRRAGDRRSRNIQARHATYRSATRTQAQEARRDLPRMDSSKRAE